MIAPIGELSRSCESLRVVSEQADAGLLVHEINTKLNIIEANFQYLFGPLRNLKIRQADLMENSVGSRQLQPSISIATLAVSVALSFGTYVATPGAITGYVTITDSTGVSRKLAVTT